MINKSGKFYTETLKSLGLNGQAAVIATDNARNIIQKIVTSFETNIGVGYVGLDGKGVPDNYKMTATGPIGLVYGRIQSGKTRAMITSTAMAFDNAIRVVLVMTSNINDLVSQTHGDFSRDLKGVTEFSKDDELDEHIDEAKI